MNEIKGWSSLHEKARDAMSSDWKWAGDLKASCDFIGCHVFDDLVTFGKAQRKDEPIFSQGFQRGAKTFYRLTIAEGL